MVCAQGENWQQRRRYLIHLMVGGADKSNIVCDYMQQYNDNILLESVFTQVDRRYPLTVIEEDSARGVEMARFREFVLLRMPVFRSSIYRK